MILNILNYCVYRTNVSSLQIQELKLVLLLSLFFKIGLYGIFICSFFQKFEKYLIHCAMTDLKEIVITAEATIKDVQVGVHLLNSCASF